MGGDWARGFQSSQIEQEGSGSFARSKGSVCLVFIVQECLAAVVLPDVVDDADASDIVDHGCRIGATGGSAVEVEQDNVSIFSIYRNGKRIAPAAVS